MAGAFSSYFQTAIGNWLKNTVFPTAPANLYVALYTAAPGEASASGTEVAGGSYARQAISVATGSWAAPSASGNAQQTSNSNAVAFPTATATWGTVVGWALYDALTGGNELYYGALTSNQTVNSGGTASFAAGQLVIQVGAITTNAMSTYLSQAIINWMRGTTFPTTPTNFYVALYTANPGPASASGTEVTGGSYARQAIAPSTGWSALGTSGTATTISNSGSIPYPTATASWGTVTGWAVYDAATVGNEILYGALTASQVVSSGNTPSFAAGQIAAQID